MAKSERQTHTFMHKYFNKFTVSVTGIIIYIEIGAFTVGVTGVI